MRKDLLLLLADKLETVVPEDRFDLETWAYSRSVAGEAPTTPDCHFAGCAIGWACMMPEFQAIGLRLSPAYTTIATSRLEPVFPIEDCPGGDYYSWEAVEKAFGLTTIQAFHLFSNEHYQDVKTLRSVRITPKKVAARIREFVASN